VCRNPAPDRGRECPGRRAPTAVHSHHNGSPTIVPSQKCDNGGAGWRVETLNAAVDSELEALSGGMRAKFVHMAELLEAFGPFQVREPYVKPLGKKLFEIRMRSKEGIARAI